MKKIILIFTLTFLLVQPVFASEQLKLTKVTVLSRHNIRSPISDKNSILGKITPHEWFNWTSRPSELSRRGALLETIMGQYFRLRLESEGLFPENYIPEEGAVRFYANGLQRTQATARYFSAGLLPVAQVPIERHVKYNEYDNKFLAQLYFFNDKYAEALKSEIFKNYGENLSVYREKLREPVNLMLKILDVPKNSPYADDILNDEIKLVLEYQKGLSISGAIRHAVTLSDALVLQYYEEPDDLKASFSHELSFDDWKKIGSVLGSYEEILCESPLFSINGANPMLKEIYSELKNNSRKFSYLCGHDTTIATFLAALDVKDYTLPNAVEPKTPIGVKVVFERFENKTGEAFYKINLVYQSVEQLRKIQPLSLENPPMIVPLFFKGLEADGQGMIKEEKLLELFKNKIDAFDELKNIFPEEKEELDDAA